MATEPAPSPPVRASPLDWGLAMGLGTPPFAAHRFTAHPSSLARTRHFTRNTLRQWGMASCVDDATTVTAELVANAVQHVLTSRPSPAAGWLGLARIRDTVLCAVSDPSRTAPTPLTGKPLAESGFGLHIVKALSDAWGCSFLAGGQGKTVWARIAA